MKILYIITKGNWGGAQKCVFDLAAAARERGLDVAAVCGSEGMLADKLRETGIRVIHAPMRNEPTPGAVREARRALERIFREERPDIVHSNSSLAGLAASLAARRAGIRRIIFTTHGWAFNEARPLWQKFAIALMHWRTVRVADVTICVSQAVRRDAAWMPFVQRRLIVVHNGVRTPAFASREEARRFLQKETVIAERLWIGAVAELHPNKRLDVLIEAFAKIAGEFPDAALVLMGEGQERNNLERVIAEKNLQSKVRLLGHVDDAPKYLHALDIFALPSHTEALSLSIIEAGFAGLPVAASDVGGIPEIIENGKTGLLVPRGDANALADSLKKLLVSSALRQDLGSALKEKVEKEFSLERTVEKIIALYS